MHRDLKPANVLLDEGSYHPRLADFGLAAHPGRVELRAGTLFHMPPEQVAEPQPDVGHDVYALGVLLHGLVSGERAGSAPRRAALRQALDQGIELAPAYAAVLAAHPLPRLQVTGDEGLGTDLDAIVARATGPAGQRYRSAADLRADVAAARSTLPLRGVDETRLRRVGKWVRRHRERVGWGALAVVLVALGAGVGLWRATRPGTLVLDGHRPGLVVEIDGHAVGAGPIAHPPGRVSIRLSAPGHRSDERLVELAPGGEAIVPVRLERRTGPVELRVEPHGARLELVGPPDDPAVPALVAPVSMDLPTGRWQVRATAAGHGTRRAQLEVGVDGARLHLSLPRFEAARIAIEGAASVDRIPGEEGWEELLVGTLRAGEPWLERRAGHDGRLLDRVAVVGLPTSPITWHDADGDGLADAVYGDDQRRLVVRLGPDLRRELWSETTGLVYHGRPTEGVRGRPLVTEVDGAMAVIFGAADGHLRARRLADGSALWTTLLVSAPNELPRELDGDPARHRDHVLAPSMDGGLYAVDLATGRVRHRYAAGSDLRTDVSVLEVDGRSLTATVDLHGRFALIDLAQEAVLRSAEGERPELLSAVPMRWTDGVPTRLRLQADGALVEEELLSGAPLRTLGSFPGATRAHALADGFVLVSGVEVGVFDHDGTERLRQPAPAPRQPVAYRGEGAATWLAWVEDGAVVLGALDTAEVWRRSLPASPADGLLPGPAVPLGDCLGEGGCEVLVAGADGSGPYLERVDARTGASQTLRRLDHDPRLLALETGVAIAYPLDEGWVLAQIDAQTLASRGDQRLPGRPRWDLAPLEGGRLPLDRWFESDTPGIVDLDAVFVPRPTHVAAWPRPVEEDVLVLTRDGVAARLGPTGEVVWETPLLDLALGGGGVLDRTWVVPVERVGWVGLDVADGRQRWRVEAGPRQTDFARPHRQGDRLLVDLAPDRVGLVDADGTLVPVEPVGEPVVIASPTRLVDARGRAWAVGSDGSRSLLPRLAPWARTGVTLHELGDGWQLYQTRTAIEVHRVPTGP